MKTFLSECAKYLKITMTIAFLISGCQLVFWLIYLYFNGEIPLAHEVHTGKDIVDTLVLQFPISRWWDLIVFPTIFLIITPLGVVYEEINNKKSFAAYVLFAPLFWILVFSLGVGSAISVRGGIHIGMLAGLYVVAFLSGVAFLFCPPLFYWIWRSEIKEKAVV